MGLHAVLRGRPDTAADRRRFGVRLRERRQLSLPLGFPTRVAAFACDLDRTLIARDPLFRDRTLAAITASRAAGIPVILATGRMFRSVRRYLDQASITEPVVCYQGALVADPASAAFLLHRPMSVASARAAIDALADAGLSPNVYIDDELFVARHTEASRRYADFQGLPVTEVGDLLDWLDRPPTKLVAIDDPARVAVLRDELRARFDGTLFVTTSLPYFLELGHPDVSKATGLAFVAERLGLEAAEVVAFGDGENDLELLQWAGFGVAVEGAHPLLLETADAVCAGPESEGVATVIAAFLDSVR